MVKQASKIRPTLIPYGEALLKGDLFLPPGAQGIIVFAHGSGSSRFSPRNRFVAQTLRDAGLASLLMDLLTEEEDALDRKTAEFRFNIPLLADRVRGCTEWLKKNAPTKDLPIGYFGASTGAAAALVAAAQTPNDVLSVVSRGGRPDLAKDFLPLVRVPTLLIVGEKDTEVLALNRNAADLIRAKCSIKVVPGASHLFEEAGALKEVARLAAEWFLEHLKPSRIEPVKAD